MHVTQSKACLLPHRGALLITPLVVDNSCCQLTGLPTARCVTRPFAYTFLLTSTLMEYLLSWPSLTICAHLFRDPVASSCRLIWTRAVLNLLFSSKPYSTSPLTPIAGGPSFLLPLACRHSCASSP